MDADVAQVLARVRVVEFSTATVDGGVNTKPMGTVWRPDTEQVVLTTPIAYAQKVHNVRRDGRVALFYSDFTGSGLVDAPAVLVQGTAEAPDPVVAPQEMEWFWRAVFRRSPRSADEFASPDHRAEWGWYYLRFPIVVSVDRLHLLEPSTVGGSPDNPLEGAALSERIKDALQRYPTAVLSAKDRNGYPFSVRATVSESDVDGHLRVEPLQPFRGTPGPASLLWHCHNGRSGAMGSLLLSGTTAGSDAGWTFTAERVPGELPHGQHRASFGGFLADGERRTAAYLQRRGLVRPEIDWDALASYTRG